MPTIETQVDLSGASRIFQEFCAVIEDKHWRKRTKQLIEHSKRNEFLRAHYAYEYAIAFQMEACNRLVEKYGTFPPGAIEAQGLMPAVAFMRQVLSLLDGLQPEKQRAFIGRIRGAFRNPDDMRALLMEFRVATHFTLRGNRVRWPELEATDAKLQDATFDLFVEDLGDDGVEVECKSASHDKGRSIHRATAFAFYERLTKELGDFARRLKTGLAVVVTVPDAIPGAPNEQADLAKRVHRQLIVGQSEAFDDGVQIGITEFEVSRLRDIELQTDSEDARAIVDELTATRNRSVLVIGRRNVGALLLVLQSSKDDELLSAVFDTAKKAARSQLSGTRPGLLLLGFEGLEAEQLASLAQQDGDSTQAPTAARIAVSQFLSGEGREHVVGVGFLSRSRLRPIGSGHFDSGGRTYYFENDTSSLWLPAFKGLFRS
ncbi:hypothetical protein [Paraburkholderia hospita]|uniref:hypothetical protein n=1 Tax=Paraburkholderia hospita TaxID=169430 RepID=UPI0008A76687|nr:hypothetical protein [Paraburkholderia hospita]SEI14728.1 hypothetical protein SAMN05192544_102598 [Paraburkholderia hospita]